VDIATVYSSWFIANSNIHEMTEKEVKMLGFTKEEGDNFYYYSYRVAWGLDFISKTNDEEGDWYVMFFNTDPEIKIYDFANAQKLINEINKYVCR
jgi:hypothetical protein